VGAIVAVCKVKAIHRTEAIAPRLSEQELAFGDYRAGRWAWELSDVERIEPAIAVSGKQGQDVPMEIEERIALMLEGAGRRMLGRA